MNRSLEHILPKVQKPARYTGGEYNAVVKARYVIITNGLQHYCYEYAESGYTQLASFPKLG